MKRTKKKLAMLTVLGTLAAFVLSGCELVTVYGLSIHKDGTGELSVKALVDEELKGAMSADDSNGDMEPIEFEGKDYYGSEEIQEFDDYNEIVDMLEDTGVFTDVEITEDSFKLTYDDSSNEDDQTQQILDGGGAVRCLLTVTFDNKVADTNGEISEDDDCTVTWDLMNLDDNELYAKVGGSSILPIILIVAGVIVVAGAVVATILVLKKKKNNGGDAPVMPDDNFTSPYAPMDNQ